MSPSKPPPSSNTNSAQKPKRARLEVDLQENDIHAGGFFEDVYNWCRQKAGLDKDEY